MAKVVAAAAEEKAPAEVRAVRLLKRPSWDSPLCPGEVIGRPVDAAVESVLTADATPEGWTPTKAELRAAAERLFVKFEASRAAHGYGAAAWLRQPGMQRRYDVIRRALEG